MTIAYEATLEDATEPAVRQFLRSKTAKTNRIRSAAIGALIAASIWVYFFHDQSALVIGITASLGVIFGGFVNYSTFIPTATGRIRKYMKREVGDKFPATTTYQIADQKLICGCLGSTISFPLSSLEQISEDKERLEIAFGKTGLCVIPLRAFTSPDQKAAFLESLNLGCPAPETL